MKGPTICRLPCGSARRTSNPSPRSRVRGTMMSSSASQVLGSPSTGSLEGCQLMGDSLQFAAIIPHLSSRESGVRMRNEHLRVIASEAKQSISPRKEKMDCFVACAPRNDDGRYEKPTNEAGTAMIPPLKPGAKLLQTDGPVIETGRLILRPWRSSDIAANTAMLSDPGTARFIAADGKP